VTKQELIKTLTQFKEKIEDLEFKIARLENSVLPPQKADLPKIYCDICQAEVAGLCLCKRNEPYNYQLDN
jgi:hypothetical protein